MEVASAGVQRAYVMGGGSVVAQRNSDGNFYWLHQDHLGSGRKMTDTSGTMTYRAEFKPYGKLLLEWSQGNQANRNSKKFTSYERDQATGLDYAEARMYSSEWGRFMSPDPLGFASANKKSPKSLNRYSYVEGNPVNSVDPSGKLLANPDEPGGSACTMTIWGSGYRTDYGGFTFTNIWGGFWSCGGGVSGGSGGGGEEEQKKKTTPPPTLQILNAGEAVLNDCGGAAFQTLLSINNTTTSLNGYIIQHVIISFLYTDDNVTAEYWTSEYLEAWDVMGGFILPAPKDNFFSPGRDGVRGTVTWKGWVKLQIGIENGIDPTKWKNDVTEADTLLRSTKDKNEIRKFSDEGGLIHTMKDEWDCVGNSPTMPTKISDVTPK